tara:strand:+ start:164 stop:322 length:159 start_codon:yes stop_codon:yes gene_type:complete
MAVGAIAAFLFLVPILIDKNATGCSKIRLFAEQMAVARTHLMPSPHLYMLRR